MALAYVGGNSNVGTGATISVSLTALSGGLASSAAIGDIVVVFWGIGASGNWTATITISTANYNYLFTQGRGNDTRDAVCRAGYKVLTAADSEVVVSGPNNSAYAGWGAVQVWRGQAASPLTGTASTASGTNDNHADPPAITPGVNDSVVICGMSGVTVSTAADTKTGPTNYTTYEVKGRAEGSGADCYFAVNARLLSGGSGVSEDPGAYSGGTTSTSDAWAAGTCAIAPLIIVPPAFLTTEYLRGLRSRPVRTRRS